MNVYEFIQLLNCIAQFPQYGKRNILAIFQWEQTILLKQTGESATLLNSYNKWNNIEGKGVKGAGVDIELDGVDEKVRFYDVSQTYELKYDRKINQEESDDTTEHEKLIFSPLNLNNIDFNHKHRGFLLTALWQELESWQDEFERLSRNIAFADVSEDEKRRNDSYMLLKHIAVIYIIHKHFKSNWHSENEIKSAYDMYYKCFSQSGIEFSENIINDHLMGITYSGIYQSTVNLLVNIEKRFLLLLGNSSADSAESYYLKKRFYDICTKDKVGVCRLKQGKSITPELSLSCYELIESLPYKPDMEREEFLEYLQQIFNNGLTEQHIILVRKRNISGDTVVTVYRIEVRDWGTKQSYINFDMETDYYPLSFYLRAVESEIICHAPSPTNSTGVAKKEDKAESYVKVSDLMSSAAAEDKRQTSESFKPVKKYSTRPIKKKPAPKKHINVIDKITQLNEDIKNKTF